MAELENARHELFAVLIARGEGTQAENYIKAGFRPKNERVASANAARLLVDARVEARVRELKAQFADAVKNGIAITTTEVLRHLWHLSNYDVRDVLTVRTVGRGRRARQELVIKDSKDWPEEMARTIQGVRTNASGVIELILPERRMPATKVGEHLGLFQGETAGQVPQGPTFIDNSTTVYIDRPPPETREQWMARVSKERGVKQIEGKSGE